MNENEKLGVGAVTTGPELPEKEKVLIGTLGALLLALVGGIACFFVYQLGYVVFVCGYITVWLANWGYQKFAKTKTSVKGSVIAVVISIVVLMASIYLSCAFEFYQQLQEFGLNYSFMDTVVTTPEFLTNTEYFYNSQTGAALISGVLADCAIVAVSALVGAFVTIRMAAKNRNAAQTPAPSNEA